jgi:hypothetical protein
MNQKKFIIMFSCLCTLSACDVRHTLGLDHYQPNEFNVSDNPPLSLPKDYKLRPPVDASKNPPSDQKASDAAQTVLGVKKQDAMSGSSEKQLVNKASNGQAIDPNIRDTVNKDAAVDTTLSGKLTEKVTSWKEEFKTNVNSINTDKKSETPA